VLSEAGYQSVPALRCAEAISIVRQLNVNLEGVILNPALPGSSYLLETFVGQDSCIRVILIGESGVAKLSRWNSQHALFEKPSSSSVIARQEWCRKLWAALKRHNFVRV